MRQRKSCLLFSLGSVIKREREREDEVGFALNDMVKGKLLVLLVG